MKLDTISQDTVIEGQFKSDDIGLSKGSSSMVFGILVNSLYSQKIQSPTREALTNHADSHLLNKVTRPIKVTITNDTFKSRDFGTGLDEKGMFRVYGSLFSSDKRENNEVSGCLGLGSLSTFAYTNSFYVSSYQSGRVTHYQFVMNGRGHSAEGQTIKLGSENTDEPDGLEVFWHLESGHYAEFLKHATSFARFSRVDVEINGAVIQKPKWNTPEFCIFREQNAYYNYGAVGTTYVRMGCVLYRSPVSYSQNLQADLILNVPLSSVEILPSREGLQDTPKTRQAIEKAAASFKKWFKENADVFISSLTPHERVRKAYGASWSGLNKGKDLEFFKDEAFKEFSVILSPEEKTFLDELRPSYRKSLLSDTYIKQSECRYGRKSKTTGDFLGDNGLYYLCSSKEKFKSGLYAHLRDTGINGNIYYLKLSNDTVPSIPDSFSKLFFNAETIDIPKKKREIRPPKPVEYRCYFRNCGYTDSVFKSKEQLENFIEDNKILFRVDIPDLRSYKELRSKLGFKTPNYCCVGGGNKKTRELLALLLPTEDEWLIKNEAEFRKKWEESNGLEDYNDISFLKVFAPNSLEKIRPPDKWEGEVFKVWKSEEIKSGAIKLQDNVNSLKIKLIKGWLNDKSCPLGWISSQTAINNIHWTQIPQEIKTQITGKIHDLLK